MENIKTTKIGQQIDKKKNKAKNAPKRIGAAAIGKVTLGKKKVYGTVELTKYFSDNRISQTRIAGYATKKKLVENKGFSLGSGSMWHKEGYPSIGNPSAVPGRYVFGPGYRSPSAKEWDNMRGLLYGDKFKYVKSSRLPDGKLWKGGAMTGPHGRGITGKTLTATSADFQASKVLKIADILAYQRVASKTIDQIGEIFSGDADIKSYAKLGLNLLAIYLGLTFFKRAYTSLMSIGGLSKGKAATLALGTGRLKRAIPEFLSDIIDDDVENYSCSFDRSEWVQDAVWIKHGSVMFISFKNGKMPVAVNGATKEDFQAFSVAPSPGQYYLDHFALGWATDHIKLKEE